jgi:hypothetical protein
MKMPEHYHRQMVCNQDRDTNPCYGGLFPIDDNQTKERIGLTKEVCVYGRERNMEEAQRITKHKKEGTFSFISLLGGSFSFFLKRTLFINAISQS